MICAPIQKHRLLFAPKTILLWLLLVSTTGCEEFVEVGPPKTQLVSETVFESDETAEAALTGIYSNLMSSRGFASGSSTSVTFLAGLSADELTNYSFQTNYISFYQNALTAQNNFVRVQLWEHMYKAVHYANAALEGLADAPRINAALRARLQGEALFIRAFSHFYLVNLFGAVPIITGTDYEANRVASRDAVADVYDAIVEDLTSAVALLDEEDVYGERTRPGHYAALALLARVYLYTGAWSLAESTATAVIAAGLYQLESPDAAFLSGSAEAIWQLQPVLPGYNTWEAVAFSLQSKPSLAALHTDLAGAFEPDDLRRDAWVDSVVVSDVTYYYAAKYKAGTNTPLVEYSIVLRLAEQHLIRAEARLRQEKTAEAKADLDVLRQRAGLPPLVSDDAAFLDDAIDHERRVELFTEWGHRWLDLKRRGTVGEVLGATKGDWQDTDALYPIPATELLNGLGLVQNPGY